MTSQRTVVQHPATELRARNILAVASGKGGVGKTWLSISLSHFLAREGQRVLLFDGDLGLANIDVQLGLTPDHDISGVVTGRVEFADAVSRFETGGFDVLPGRSGSGSLGRLNSERLLRLRQGLVEAAGRYDTVVLDLAAGVDAAVRNLAAASGTCLVISNDEPTSLTDAYAFIKVLARDNPGADVRVVINMAESESKGFKTYQTLLKAARNFLNIEPPLAGIIRRDTMVRESIRRQIPLFTRHPNADAAIDVEKLARAVAGPPEPVR